MDHHQQQAEQSPPRLPEEAFLDEPEHDNSQTQPQTNCLRRPLHIQTPENEDDSLESRHHHHHQYNNTELPRMLKLLYGLNGLSLSLLTLPIMYILNTRVAVPLPYLPAYGAIAFLPCSLKPMYAYLSGLWAAQKSTTTRIDGPNTINNHAATEALIRKPSPYSNSNKHRYLSLFRWLLASNSICTLLTATIPKGGVMAVFVVAFLRGITDSWAEFCLGLTLIDHAAANAANSYETTVSGLQAQAATSRNLGSWLASLVTFLVLVWRARSSSDDDEEPQLNGAITNGLVVTTALVQLGAAVSVYLWEKKEFNNTSNSNGMYEELPTRQTPIAAGLVPTESDSLRDDERSHPSYSSLEDLSDDETLSLSTEGSDFIRANSSSNNGWSPQRIANWAMVILLQCVLMVIALKAPIIEVSSHFVWGVLVVTLLVGILLASITLCCKLGNNSNAIGNANGHDMTTFRVGLFLVLKNAIPSESAILASFFYSLFGTNQPLLLQFLSFLGMGVSSLSSWSYTRLFSKRFGSGRPLVTLMAGTVTLASLASLLHLGVFRIYQADNGETDDETWLPSRKLLVMAILSKFVTTFFGEWAFLPELVLATTSVKVSATPPTTNTPSEAIDDPEAGIPRDSAIVSNTPIRHNHGSGENNNSNNVNEMDQQRIAMEYGTLVSCIDFGDQLGSLLAAPLVAVWQISRENGFLHLDRLIVFCSVANVAITIGLLPLLWNIPKSKR